MYRPRSTSDRTSAASGRQPSFRPRSGASSYVTSGGVRDRLRERRVAGILLQPREREMHLVPAIGEQLDRWP